MQLFNTKEVFMKTARAKLFFILPLFSAVAVPSMLFSAEEAPAGSVTSFKPTPLGIASCQGNVEEVKKLIAAKADVNACNEVLVSERAGDRESIKDIARPLTGAARGGNVEIVELLLKNGAYVNNKNGTFGAPLKGAIRANSLEIVKLLVEAKADVAAKNEDGDTPTTCAAEKEHWGIYSLLTELTKKNWVAYEYEEVD